MKKEYFKKNLQYLILFISFLIVPKYNYAQVNLIKNASFEDDSAYWVFGEGASRVQSDSKSGNYSLSANTNSKVEQTISGLTPNTTYLLSAWLKSSSSKPVIIGAKHFGGNAVTATTDSNNYQLLSIKFTTGPANNAAIIYLQNPTTSKTVLCADDLSLIYTPETPYALVWSDEFNGNGIVDAANWNFENGFVRNEEVQWYQTDNAFQQDGNLIFEGRKENPFNTRLNPNYKPNSKNWKKSRQYINYTASSITTRGKQSWLYGRFEIRAKVTNQTGTWPAIWTLGNECEWPYNGEVDIMENYGENILANFAWGTNKRFKAKWDTVRLNTIKTFVEKDPDWLSKFHIWSMDWDENRMSIYLDGVLLNDVDLNTTINGKYNCSGQNPFKQKHYLLLNLALGGQGGSVDNLAFPTQYVVDYVRVYQLKLTTSNN